MAVPMSTLVPLTKFAAKAFKDLQGFEIWHLEPENMCFFDNFDSPHLLGMKYTKYTIESL